MKRDIPHWSLCGYFAILKIKLNDLKITQGKDLEH